MQHGNITKNYFYKSESQKKYTHVEGYASVFGNTDQDNEVIVKGAFRNTRAGDVKLLWQHDHSKPIGVIKFLEEDEYGLRIKAEINNETVYGKEASALVRQGALGGLSIGFRCKEDTYNKGIREISNIDLMEVSIVTFPSNKEAQISSVKSMKDESRELEQLKDSLTRLEQTINNN